MDAEDSPAGTRRFGSTRVDRRDALRLSAAAGVATAVTLCGVSFARAADGPDGGGDGDGNGADGGGTEGGRTARRTLRGHLPTGAPDFVYLPVEVPEGVREIAVSYRYDKPAVPAGTPGNALDIGVFDERGTGLGGRGFRGWSGGFRDSFTISAQAATPGYLAGPVRAGTWHVVLGPYTVAPQGMDYEVTVTVRYGERGRTPRPVHPPERARGRGRAWYRGDCHLHTVHSDGARTPAQVAATARAAGLDFLTTTEHNTTSGHAAWEGLWGEDLLVLCGEEITTRNGHWLAVGTDPGHVLRLALPGARRRLPALRARRPACGRPGGAGAPPLPVRRLPVEVRLRARGRGGGVERPLDGRRRDGAGGLGQHARQPRQPAARHGQQ